MRLRFILLNEKHKIILSLFSFTLCYKEPVLGIVGFLCFSAKKLIKYKLYHITIMSVQSDQLILTKDLID